ncbi:MAG TPA: hypothetical protein VET48_11760, partial [Steroidobacteraceae bacterium]|nr:hypothetical protein [Steroidobacteraceae bacterium]
FYGFAGLGVAWQVLFLVIARDPLRFRLAMLPSIIEKISFGASTIWLFIDNRVTLQLTLLSCVDLCFAALFAISYLKTRAATNTQ